MREKHYTFKVLCTFEMQYTFIGSEVEHDPDGENESVEPTDKALKALEDEVRGYLSEHYPIDEIDVSSESDLIVHNPSNPGIGK